MAVNFIEGAREKHSVTSVKDLINKHRAFINRKRNLGARYEVHEVDTQMPARVAANHWLIDCDCGSGVLTDPEFGMGCCFACGAIYRNILYPARREEIEEALKVRPWPDMRFWKPGETPEDLHQENASVGLNVKKGEALPTKDEVAARVVNLARASSIEIGEVKL